MAHPSLCPFCLKATDYLMMEVCKQGKRHCFLTEDGWFHVSLPLEHDEMIQVKYACPHCDQTVSKCEEDAITFLGGDQSKGSPEKIDLIMSGRSTYKVKGLTFVV